jgi:hypothetical protein
MIPLPREFYYSPHGARLSAWYLSRHATTPYTKLTEKFPGAAQFQWRIAASVDEPKLSTSVVLRRGVLPWANQVRAHARRRERTSERLFLGISRAKDFRNLVWLLLCFGRSSRRSTWRSALVARSGTPICSSRASVSRMPVPYSRFMLRSSANRCAVAGLFGFDARRLKHHDRWIRKGRRFR